MSRCIWALVDEEIAEHMTATTEPSAKQWLFQMMESMSHEAFVKLVMTLWATWWARRKACNYLGSSALVIYGVQKLVALQTIACREALGSAKDLLTHDLTVVTESSQVVRDIQRGSGGQHVQIVTEIKRTSENFNVSFSSESRASIHEAYLLAKFSLSFNQGRHVCLRQPHDSNCIPLWRTLINKAWYC